MTKEKFYAACAAILRVGHPYTDKTPAVRVDPHTLVAYRPPTRATRWGGREPGNGRFPGFGLARMFASDRVQLVITRPVSINRTFESPEAALAYLRMAIPAEAAVHAHDGRGGVGKARAALAPVGVAAGQRSAPLQAAIRPLGHFPAKAMLAIARC